MAFAVLVLLRAFAGPWILDGTALPNSRDDFLFHGVQIKTILELGWYPVTNPLLGAPWGAEPFDFPNSDALSISVVRLLGLLWSDWQSIAKAHYVLGFLLVALFSYVLFVELEAPPPWAAAGGVVVAFLPFHFLRIPHLFLAFYVAVPLAIWVALMTGRRDLLRPQARSSRWRLGLAFAACIAVGSGGAYYAFFGAMFVIASGVFFGLSQRSRVPLGNASLLAGVIALVVAAGLVPHWRYKAEHGPNPVALPQRDLMASESNSLKLAQLLLPTPNHRVESLRAAEMRYASGAPLVAENRASALGFVGAAGLLLLALNAVLVLAGRAALSSPALSWLSFLAGVALVVASVGSLNSLMVLFVSPLLRGWNRISVFVGLFAAGAVALCAANFFRMLARRFPDLPVAAAGFVASAALAIFAAWDQTPILEQASFERQARNDRAFFAQLQERVPAGGLVFQLPYFPFPEGGNTARWPDYAHARAYLHTHGIAWSYGAMKGRDADKWYHIATLLPPARLVRFVAEHGFSGIYVDRLGYADDGRAIASALDRELGPPSVRSEDGNLLFYGVRATGIPRADFHGLMGVTRSASIPPARGICHLDSVRGAPAQPVVSLRSDELAEIRGWVGDVPSGLAPTAATIYLGNEGERLSVLAHAGLPRPDVAAATGKKDLAASGFVAMLPGREIPAGTYTVAIGFADANGQWACPTGYRINVIGSAGG